MDSFKEVAELPVLDQTGFPELPQVPDDRVFIGYSSHWNKAVKEFAVGIIITLCVRDGAWMPVSVEKFLEILNNHPLFGLFKRAVIDEVWWFNESGLLEMIKVKDEQFIVPTPEIAQIATRAKTIRHE